MVIIAQIKTINIIKAIIRNIIISLRGNFINDSGLTLVFLF